jgi:hypothetical protein
VIAHDAKRQHLYPKQILIRPDDIHELIFCFGRGKMTDSVQKTASAMKDTCL